MLRQAILLLLCQDWLLFIVLLPDFLLGRILVLLTFGLYLRLIDLFVQKV